MTLVGSELALAPLGAGDLIDRAVRLYRRHFLTLIRIAAPPVLISATGSTFTFILELKTERIRSSRSPLFSNATQPATNGLRKATASRKQREEINESVSQ